MRGTKEIFKWHWLVNNIGWERGWLGLLTLVFLMFYSFEQFFSNTYLQAFVEDSLLFARIIVFSPFILNWWFLLKNQIDYMLFFILLLFYKIKDLCHKCNRWVKGNLYFGGGLKTILRWGCIKDDVYLRVAKGTFIKHYCGRGGGV